MFARRPMSGLTELQRMGTIELSMLPRTLKTKRERVPATLLL